MDSVNEDVSARILLQNVLHTEPPRSPVTRSVSQAQRPSLRAQRSGRLRRSDIGSLTPQEALKRSIKQKLRESTSRTSLPPSKRRTVSAVVRKMNTPAPATGSLMYDDDVDVTPRHLLRGILQTEPETSLLFQDRPVIKEPELLSADSSLHSNHPSTGLSGLDLPDMTTVNLTNTVKGLSRKRPRRSLNVTAFERHLERGEGEGSGDSAEDLSTLSQHSLSSATLSLKTPFVDVKNEERGLLRKVANRPKISVEEFDNAVQNRQKGGNPELSFGDDRQGLGEPGITLGMSDLADSDITNDIFISKTTLYAHPVTTGTTSSIATQDKDTVSSTQILQEFEAVKDVEEREKEEVEDQRDEEEQMEVENRDEEELSGEDEEREGSVRQEGVESTSPTGEEELAESDTQEEELPVSQTEQEVAGSQGEEEDVAESQIGEEDVAEAQTEEEEEEEEEPKSEIGEEDVTESQTEGEDVPESQTIEDVPESQIEEDVPESQTEEDVPESQTEEDVPESQSEEDVPESQTEEDVPESQSEEDVPESQTEEDIPESQSEEDVPESQTEEDIPESQTEEDDVAEYISRRAHRSEGGVKVPVMMEGGRGYKSMGAELRPRSEGGTTGEWHSGPDEVGIQSDHHHTVTLGSVPPSPSPQGNGLETEGSRRTEASSGNEEKKSCMSPLEINESENDTYHSSTSPPQPITAQSPADPEEDWVEEEEEGEDSAQSQELSMKTPAFVRERRNALPTDPLSTPTVLKDVQARVSTGAAAKVKPKVVRAKRAGPAKKDPGLPKSYIMSVFKHFAKTKVSADVYPVLKEIMERYFDRLADDLETYAAHAKRKTIEVEDVELLMRRQGFVTDSMPVNVLIEKYLPMEYRKLLIPVATSGNYVIPKQRRR